MRQLISPDAGYAGYTHRWPEEGGALGGTWKPSTVGFVGICGAFPLP